MHGDETGELPARDAVLKKIINNLMIRVEHCFPPCRPFRGVQSQIAGDGGTLRDGGDDSAGRARVSVTVDNQPRIALVDQRGLQSCAQPLRHAERADILADVARDFPLRQSKRIQPARYAFTGVIAKNHEGRTGIRSDNADGFRFILRQQRRR